MSEFIKAIPAIISLIQELVTWVKELQAQKKEADLSNFILQTAKYVRESRNAKTMEEKFMAVKHWHDITGKL